MRTGLAALGCAIWITGCYYPVPEPVPQPYVAPRPYVRPPPIPYSTEVRWPTGTQRATVILLHGLMGDASQMMDMGQFTFMSGPLSEHVKFVSVNAPNRSWFDMLTSDLNEMNRRIQNRQEVVDRFSLDRAMDRIVTIIDREAAQLPADHSQVYLVGYSQGAMLALWTALMGERSLGGVVLLSGSLPIINLGRIKFQGLSVPIMHIHGSLDANVPIANAQGGAELVRAAGNRNYDFRIQYGGFHEPKFEARWQVRNWLIEKIGL